ncbi:GNAT family N-acetyltransferase [Streptomyces sp. NBC_00076]|uniref:GNAT family N-acetyltransferase n=1 Tax=Streptomyces sp. NBC_00076 TaxID=2975642 RepID=UPI00324E3EFE
MGVAVRTAGAEDRELLVRLLDQAFQDDPVSCWVFPGDEHRRMTHPMLMGAFTDIVLAEGRVDVTEDGTACALWLSVPGDDHGHDSAADDSAADGSGLDDSDDSVKGDAAESDGPALLREAVDPDNERVELIGRLTADIHPEGRAHAYLWMIAVAPERQGEGLGTALMASVLDRCDREGLPAYLEASNARSRKLYERLGFTLAGRPLDLPDGPTMWPMWREPQG